uniref:Uncharacterized protein n=1 Tax=Rhizophora mucronata TaxID=61149 RepID=A0A2P2N5S2_RHIMU
MQELPTDKNTGQLVSSACFCCHGLLIIFLPFFVMPCSQYSQSSIIHITS